jgi:hypothetical protein
MAEITSSLFPEVGNLFQRQQQQNMAAASNLAQGGYAQAALASGMGLGAQAGGLLGKGISGALGMTSPEEDEIRATKEIADRLTQEGTNLQSYAGMSRLAQELNQQGKYNAANKAMTAANILREKEQSSALSTAQLGKVMEENKNNADFKAALTQLGPNPTSEDIANVAIRFSSADKAVTVMQGAAEKQAAREQAATMQEDRLAQAATMQEDRLAQAATIASDKLESIERQKEADRKSREAIANLGASLKSANNDIQREMITTRMEDLKSKMQERQTAQLRKEENAIVGFDTAIASLDTIAAHPGKKDVVGRIGGASVLAKIPGTDAAGFVSHLDTVRAQTFLPQIESLRGMGALSNEEGKQLRASVGALNTDMKQTEFDTQVTKIKASLQAARNRLTSSSTVLPKINSPETAPAASGAPLTIDQRLARYPQGAK